MIKRSLLLAILVLPLIGWAQQDFRVSGKVGNLNTPAKAYLIYADNEGRMVDSAAIKNGAFEFSGSVSQPTLANLAIDHEGVGIHQMRSPDLVNVYLEKGTIEVSSSDSISNAILSGTDLNEDQHKLTASIKPIVEKMKALVAQYQSSTDEQMNSEGFMSEMQSKYEKLQKEVQLKQIEFIESNPESLISLFSLVDIAGSSEDLVKVEEMFKSLDASLKNTVRGKSLLAQIQTSKSVAIGAIAPDFTQADTAGNPVTLSDFRGEYVLLDFWASWCAPCRAENPNIVAAYQKFKDKNFTVLGVSLDQEGARDAWLKAIHDDKLTWTQVSDLKFWNNEAAQMYGIRAIPQSYLLDPEGRIIAVNLRGEELHQKLDEVLSNDT